jgi:hypothetical protein
MGDIFWIVIIATSIWVLVDAKTIGVKKGQIQGMGNIGPWGWFFVCLLILIGGFPFYLAKRSEFKRINGKKRCNPTLDRDGAKERRRLSQRVCRAWHESIWVKVPVPGL